MKKHTRFTKSISKLLVFTLVWSLILPLFPEPVQSEGLGTQITPPTERVELVEHRTANSKRFQNPDGTLTEEVYLDNVHYKQNNKWEAIDNTLIPSTNTDFDYKNKANSFTVEFAKNNNGNSFVRYGIEDRTIDMRPIGLLVAHGQASGNKMTYPKGTGEAGLPVELEYTVGNNILKEDIILDSYQKINRFTFQLKLTNVYYIQETDGTIGFYDQETNQKVFMFTKPYMIDSNETFSDKVAMQIREEGSNLFIDIIPDDEWLKDPNRAYPVRIDPTLEPIQPGADNGRDSHVSLNYPNSSYYTTYYMSVGYDSTGGLGKTRGLIRFNLPSLPSSSTITSSTLDLYHYYNFSSSVNVGVHKMTGDWTSSTATWNNTLDKIATTAESTKSVNGVQWFSFDITNLVNSWYNGQVNNYGVALKQTDESLQRRLFYTSDYATDPSKHPKLIINYDVNPIGDEDFWTYSNNVHIANGNLMLNDSDVYITGRGPATTVTRTYNGRSTSSGIFGYGWSSELDMRIYPVNKGPISLRDADGTIHYFGENAEGGGTYTSPPGLYLELIKNTDNTYSVIDKGGIEYKFASDGKLINIIDLNGNSLTLEYTNGEVSKITDASGRYTTISAKTNYERLITDSANRVTKYIYNAAGDLIQVKKAFGTTDEAIISYEYDSTHNLTALTDGRGNKTYFYYWDDDRIKSINPINKVINSNFEVDSDGNNIPDSWSYDTGQNGVGSYDATQKQDGYGSFKLTTSNANPATYSVYLSDKIPVSSAKNYKLTGYLKGSQTSGSLTTVLSLIAYDSNNTNLGEYARIAVSGTFDWQKADQSIIANTTLPTQTSYVKVKIAASNATGSGTSWYDSIQLEEGTTASEYTGSMTYTVDRVYKYSAVYDANGKKIKYRYNDSGNVLETHLDPNGYDYTSTYTWDNQNNMLTMKDANANAYGYTEPSIDNTYDSNGNVTDIIIDDGTIENITNEFAYSNNDLTKATDANNVTNEYEYDGNRNLVTLKESAKNVSSITYFSNGNINYETSTTGIDENLAYNSGFELDENSDNMPDNWLKTINGSATVESSSTALSGNKSLAVTNVAGAGSYVIIKNDKSFTLSEGDSFTLSVYAKATTEAAAKSAYLKVDAYGETNNYLGQVKGKSIGEVDSWNRLQLVVDTNTLPVGTKKIIPSIVVTTNPDTVYIDNYQLERTSKLSSYNMLQNSSFETGTTEPENWSNTTSTLFTWEQTDPTKVFTGSKSVKIANPVGLWAGYQSTEFIPYEADKKYTLTGFVKTENVTNPSEVYIKLKYYDQNKNEISSKSSNLLSTGTNGWTRQIVHIAENEAPINTAYIKPVLVAHDFNGTAYFDAIKLQEGNIKVGYEYNAPAENYVTKITDQNGNIVTFVPDSVGNITRTTDAKGNQTSYTYNSFNQLKTVTIPGYDLKTVFEYDKNGNLTTIRNEGNTGIYNTTSYVYNKVNQIASVTDPLNKTTNYVYDPSGNLEEINYPTGDSLSFIYDKANRLTEEKYNGATKYSYTQYDPNGNLKEVKQVIDGSNKTWAFNYDRVDRLISVIAPDGSKQENEFDKNSNRTKQTLTINTLSYINLYSYDSSDYPKQLIDHNEKNSYFAYDKSGSLTQQILGNGAVSSYTFDETNQVSKVLNTKSDGSLISSYIYAYDANSNIATVTDNTGKIISYSYDTINQLLSETDPLSTNTFVYQYDNLGNRTKKEVKNGETVISTTTFGYNVGNQLTSVNSQPLIYDNNGNLTDDGTKLYIWDAAGRLIEVRNKVDNSLIAQYEYDYMGRRIKSTADGVVTNYHYDGGSINVLYETDASNSLTKLYTYSEDGMLLSMTKVDGANKTTYYYHYNARGDVVKLTDQSGVEVASYTYDAWGNILSSSGTMAGENPYRYAGYRYDSDINLYYLMARYYNPETGRFLSKDPIPDAVNDYIYAGNNPVNYVDPEGERADPYNGYMSLGGGGKSVGFKPKWKVKTGSTKGTSKSFSINSDGLAIGGKIKGYTTHGKNQALGRDGGRGVSNEAIWDAVNNPIKVVKQPANKSGYGPTYKYEGKKAVVVLNESGEVVTTYAKSSQGVRSVK